MDILQIYNTLFNELDLGAKSIKRLAHLVQNNTDRSCFLTSDHRPVTDVSPVISGRMGTKQLTKAFKTIGIYNLVLDRYDHQKKIWYFCGFTQRCQLVNVSVARHLFEKPLVFEDAVAVAVLECRKYVSQMKTDEISHTAFIASEIELEPSESMCCKLNDLNTMANCV